MKTDEEPIVVEQQFNRSVSDLWNAITNIDEMRQWYFENIPEFEARVGFCTQFSVEAGDRIFPHVWEVTEAEPQHKLVYNWKYDGYAGDSFVIFELSGDGQSSHLRVTSRIVEDFPDDIPEFNRESGVGGWTYFIKDSLKAYLDE